MRVTSMKMVEEMMVKVIVDADTDKVLGIHYVGKDAGEIMQGFGTAIFRAHSGHTTRPRLHWHQS